MTVTYRQCKIYSLGLAIWLCNSPTWCVVEAIGMKWPLPPNEILLFEEGTEECEGSGTLVDADIALLPSLPSSL